MPYSEVNISRTPPILPTTLQVKKYSEISAQLRRLNWIVAVATGVGLSLHYLGLSNIFHMAVGH